MRVRSIRRPRCAPAIAIFALLAGPMAEAEAQTRDTVVTRALLAMGGSTRLRATRTRVVTGKISFDGSEPNPFTVEQKRPQKLHMEIFFPAGVLVRAYDGQSAWQASPFAERREPAPMSVEETRHIAEEAEFDDALLDWEARGSHLELLGKEMVRGRLALHLRLTARDTLVQHLFYDAATFLKVKWQGARAANGKTTVFESFFSDHRPVEGLVLPFRIESQAQGTEARQEIVITRVELNTPIDDARFVAPRGAPTPAPARSAKP